MYQVYWSICGFFHIKNTILQSHDIQHTQGMYRVSYGTRYVRNRPRVGKIYETEVQGTPVHHRKEHTTYIFIRDSNQGPLRYVKKLTKLVTITGATSLHDKDPTKKIRTYLQVSLHQQPQQQRKL